MVSLSNPWLLLLHTSLILPFTIMLDPAGNGKNIGRSLHDNFERGATLQFAQELQKQLKIYYPQVNVIISRSSGQKLEKLQSASFANRLNVDLFLNLGFYKEHNVKPNLFLYQFKNQSFFANHNQDFLHFYPYHQAFVFNYDKTKHIIGLMQKHLQHPDYKHYFTCHQSLEIPFKPLSGIISPAIGIEIGLKHNGYEPYIMPIIHSLAEVIYEL